MFYMALAKSKHHEKALHIALLALAGTIQRLTTGHYARGGLIPQEPKKLPFELTAQVLVQRTSTLMLN